MMHDTASRSARSRLTGSGTIAVLALLLAGCGSTGDSGGGEVDPAGTWGAGGEGQPQLELDADGSFSGTDGCNQIGGSWEAAGAEVRFGETRSTLMFCEGVDDWLGGLATATVDADLMTVFDDTGTQIGTLTRGS